jgi:hypothetical protein
VKNAALGPVEGRVDEILVVYQRRGEQVRHKDRCQDQQDDHDAAAQGDLVASQPQPGDLTE